MTGWSSKAEVKKNTHSGPDLSVVIITLNEARNIGRCLRSVQFLTDDIVVADSGSCDRTEEICRKFNVRFERLDWKGYAATKNEANALAEHGYILSLDADESLSPALLTSIRIAIENGLEGVYSFNRLTNYCGHWVRHGGWYPDRKLRIFPCEAAQWEGDFVHEQLVYDNLSLTHLPGNLLHHSYYTVNEHRERIEHYAALHAKAMKSSGKHLAPIHRLFGPFWKFFQTYFLKAGFMDGRTGYTIAALSARAVRRKYCYLREPA